jgi:NtrC-family two-component system response regulator AlgB
MALLLNYSWPGNIRELRNVLERLLILSQGTEMKPEHLPESVREGIQRRLPGDTPGSMKSLEEIERDHIAKVLAYESNQEKAAKILGITTVTLWRKRKQLGLA